MCCFNGCYNSCLGRCKLVAISRTETICHNECAGVATEETKCMVEKCDSKVRQYLIKYFNEH